MSTKLPAQVPFNDPVTVCSACRRASCAMGRCRCDEAKRGLVALAYVALAELQAASEENPSYWKPQRPEDESDIPIDVEDMAFLIRFQRGRPGAERSMMAGYLEHELGIDPKQVAAAMAKEWPEAGGSP